MALYDTIGRSYAQLRRPDPRIAAQIDAALGDAKTVVNVGAGTGSYEPEGRVVTAVEPSAQMIAQRSPGPTQVVQASAEALPFDDDSFDAAMAVLTIHHWSDRALGLSELRRVTRGRIVLLTCDPEFDDFWLYDYLPGLLALDQGKMPTMAQLEDWLGPIRLAPVEIPHDCQDGFLAAYWRRPEAYLRDEVRRGSSTFWALGDVSGDLARLGEDLKTGAWDHRFGALRDRTTLDCGYRLVVAEGGMV